MVFEIGSDNHERCAIALKDEETMSVRWLFCAAERAQKIKDQVILNTP
jgi:hypothetical protein